MAGQPHQLRAPGDLFKTWPPQDTAEYRYPTRTRDDLGRPRFVFPLPLKTRWEDQKHRAAEAQYFAHPQKVYWEDEKGSWWYDLEYPTKRPGPKPVLPVGYSDRPSPFDDNYNRCAYFARLYSPMDGYTYPGQWQLAELAAGGPRANSPRKRTAKFKARPAPRSPPPMHRSVLGRPVAWKLEGTTQTLLRGEDIRTDMVKAAMRQYEAREVELLNEETETVNTTKAYDELLTKKGGVKHGTRNTPGSSETAGTRKIPLDEERIINRGGLSPRPPPARIEQRQPSFAPRHDFMEGTRYEPEGAVVLQPRTPPRGTSLEVPYNGVHRPPAIMVPDNTATPPPFLKSPDIANPAPSRDSMGAWRKQEDVWPGPSKTPPGMSFLNSSNFQDSELDSSRHESLLQRADRSPRMARDESPSVGSARRTATEPVKRLRDISVPRSHSRGNSSGGGALSARQRRRPLPVRTPPAGIFTQQTQPAKNVLTTSDHQDSTNTLAFPVALPAVPETTISPGVFVGVPFDTLEEGPSPANGNRPPAPTTMSSRVMPLRHAGNSVVDSPEALQTRQEVRLDQLRKQLESDSFERLVAAQRQEGRRRPLEASLSSEELPHRRLVDISDPGSGRKRLHNEQHRVLRTLSSNED